MSEAIETQDKWQILLDEQLKILQECQKQQNLDSCLICPKVLDCTTREEYIRAVYSSMNKGEGGGFEF